MKVERLAVLSVVIAAVKACSVSPQTESPPGYLIPEVKCREGNIIVTIAKGDSFPQGYRLDDPEATFCCGTSKPDSRRLFTNHETSYPVTDSLVCTIMIEYALQNIDDSLAEEEKYFFPEPWICNYTTNTTVEDTSTTLEVALSVDASCAAVGTVVNFTCTVNGTPPLDVCLKTENTTGIDGSECNKVEGIDLVQAFSVEVLESGSQQFTCVVTNSTGHQKGSQLAKVAGLVTLHFQICFKLPDDYSCNRISGNESYSDILLDIANLIWANSSCNELESSSVSTFCNPSCQERLFYNASVLVEDETQFNLSLHSLASNGSFLMGGLEVTPNYGCSAMVGSGPLPHPSCPGSSPTSVQTTSLTSVQTTSHADANQEPTPSASATSSTGQTEDGQTDVFTIVAGLVLALLTTFVLLLLISVLIMCLVHHKRKSASDSLATVETVWPALMSSLKGGNNLEGAKNLEGGSNHLPAADSDQEAKVHEAS